MRAPRVLFALAAIVASGCVRPDVFPVRKGPPVVSDAVLWTFVPIARAPQAYFDFHLRLDPPPACPLVVFEWGDGDLSARESDCEPGDVGAAVFDARHIYRVPGEYEVVASVIEAGRVLARTKTTVIVLPGLGQ